MRSRTLAATILRALMAVVAIGSMVVCLAPAQATGTAGKVGACPAGRCKVYRVPAPHGVHITDDHVEVMLPAGYATSPHRHYPVIYLFNGLLGVYDEWIRYTDVGTYSGKFPAIFVDFASGTPPAASYFCDWRDGTYQWESWHTRTVIPWVNKHFRTIPSKTAAIGVSLGSTGALGYQERHPGLFKTIATFSGLVDTQFLTPISGYDEASQDPAVTRAWGDQVLNADVWAAHNPTANAAKLAGTKLFIATGTGSFDPTNDSIHSPQREADIWADHPTFLAALAAAGIPHTDRFYQGGAHDWPYFIEDLHWAVPQIMQTLR